MSVGGIRALSIFSLGYGRHITNSNSYLGFIGMNLGSIGINKSILPIFTEVKYGYEFMRQNTFSFGLDILALIIKARTVRLETPPYVLSSETFKVGIGGGFDAYLRTKVTESISILLKTGGWVIMPSDPVLYITLGARYHF